MTENWKGKDERIWLKKITKNIDCNSDNGSKMKNKRQIGK
jgi:hypothetical protein